MSGVSQSRMFQFDKDTSPEPHCYFTHCHLPGYVDAKEPPSKKRPFSLFNSHDFVHTVDLLLPEEIYELIKPHLDTEIFRPRYARVYLCLLDILSGKFFNHYIKTPGNDILLLSDGLSPFDNIFRLSDGVLHIELDHATYERAGLVGKPMPSGGRKHARQRYAVDVNLRLPSMVHGKNGFERLVYAAKNVLNQSFTWLFVDLQVEKARLRGETGQHVVGQDESPLQQHAPKHTTVQPEVIAMHSILTPQLHPSTVDEICDPETSLETYEWLNLVSLSSPRLHASDSIDPLLSRYDVLRIGAGEGRDTANLVRVRWHGFLTPQLVTQIWILASRQAGEKWIAMNVGCFGGASYTTLALEGEACLSWECA